MIQGYAVEEFTHQAAAAMIACGAADAGLGVRAAAERFGLDFVTLGWKNYDLAASCLSRFVRPLRQRDTGTSFRT